MTENALKSQSFKHNLKSYNFFDSLIPAISHVRYCVNGLIMTATKMIDELSLRYGMLTGEVIKAVALYLYR